MSEYARVYTVWAFSSATMPEQGVIIKVKSAEPNDLFVQHSYQKILFRGLCNSPKEALEKAATK